MELRQYIVLGLRWWWLIVLAALVGGGTGYCVSRQQAPVYQAATTVLVGQSIQATELTAADMMTSERLARTYADIARRQPVLQAVIGRLSLADSWQGLRDRVRVTPVRDTQLLEISVEAGSAEEARVTADEVANQLILLSPTSLENQKQNENQRFVRQRLESLQAKIENGQARLKELETAMTGSLSAEQVQELQSEITTLEGLVANWENNYTQLLIFVEGEKSPNYLAIVEPAQGSLAPVRPQVVRTSALAAIVGILLALGLVFLVEYLDDTVKSTDDLVQVLELTPLGAIRRIDGRGYQEKLIASHDLFSPVVEAYRMVRSNIQFMAVDRPARSIMVTSATPQEGKSITAANLAVVMAQAGLNTILVDADLRRPRQHEIFEVLNLNGLTELLRSPGADPNDHLRPTGVEHLRLMPSGVLPPNPAELLGSQRMGQVLANLDKLADVVIYDSPPVLAVADAAVLSNRVDGVILVTEAGRTRLGLASQALQILQQAGARVLGGLLNRVSGSKSGYYYYQHYSPNGHGPSAPPAPARPEPRRQGVPFFK